jgi:hypothetical protein
MSITYDLRFVLLWFQDSHVARNTCLQHQRYDLDTRTGLGAVVYMSTCLHVYIKKPIFNITLKPIVHVSLRIHQDGRCRVSMGCTPDADVRQEIHR